MSSFWRFFRFAVVRGVLFIPQVAAATWPQMSCGPRYMYFYFGFCFSCVFLVFPMLSHLHFSDDQLAAKTFCEQISHRCRSARGKKLFNWLETSLAQNKNRKNKKKINKGEPHTSTHTGTHKIIICTYIKCNFFFLLWLLLLFQQVERCRCCYCCFWSRLKP